MSDSPEEIERESEQRRAHVAALVDELRDHVTPAEIIGQIVGPEAGGEFVQAAGSYVREQVRKNPVPVAVIGVGVAWLLLADGLRRQRQIPLYDGLDYERDPALSAPSRSGILSEARRVVRVISQGAPRAREPRLHTDEEVQNMTQPRGDTNGEKRPSINGGNSEDQTNADVQVGESALQGSEERKSGLVSGAVDRATGLAQTALQKSGEALSDARDAVSQTASSLVERTNDMATRTRRAVTEQATNAGSGIAQLAREQPLLVAGIGFALGVAVGALLPLSRAENDLLGEQADRLKDSASELASESYEKAKAVAKHTLDTATDTLKSEAERQGLSGSAEGSSSGGGQGTASSGENRSPNYGSDDGGDNSSTAYRH
jgi:ElaB/YqjD/DUF883 family membrane-anchored ribosome-binding protein